MAKTNKKKKPEPEDSKGFDSILKHKAVTPAELSKFKATLSSLSSGNYQRKLLKHYAPEGILTGIQSLIQSSAEGSVQASVKLLEVYRILESKSAVSIVNNVDARSLQVSEGQSEEARGFANIARMLVAEREKRRLEGSPAVGRGPTLDATFTETPSEPRKD